MLGHCNHVRLFATLWTIALQATLSTGFSRQILQWVAMPSSKVSSWPRDWTCVSWGCCIVGGSLPLSHQGSPKQSSMALFSALPGLSYGPLEYVFNLKYLNHIMEIIWVILVFIYTINTGEGNDNPLQYSWLDVIWSRQEYWVIWYDPANNMSNIVFITP